jgi:hypothetical protein
MSGYMDNAFLGELQAANREVIQKPFKKEVILSKIRETLDSLGSSCETRIEAG